MKRTKEEKEEFIRKNYITCQFCGYNNERSRNLQFGTCLNCGKILDKKAYFMIEMLRRIKEDKRRNR